MTEELFRENAYLRHCEATVTGVDAAGIVLDRTVFYPLGGGQPGDTGRLILGDGRELTITDTRKGAEPGTIVHTPAPGGPRLETGTPVTLEIDWERRYRHMRLHTCLHLLCSLIDAPVTGGSISADKARLDFDLPEPTIDKESLTAGLNALIESQHPVTASWISDAELEAQPELVRTMSVQPPGGQGRVRLMEIAGVDLQPCGGTHVSNTGEIGRVRVSKIEKKSRHNRRVIVTFAD